MNRNKPEMMNGFCIILSFMMVYNIVFIIIAKVIEMIHLESFLALFDRSRSLSGHGVVARAAPWIASEDAAEGQPAAFEGTVFLYCLHGILRAGGCVTAGGRGEG